MRVEALIEFLNERRSRNERRDPFSLYLFDSLMSVGNF